MAVAGAICSSILMTMDNLGPQNAWILSALCFFLLFMVFIIWFLNVLNTGV